MGQHLEQGVLVDRGWRDVPTTGQRQDARRGHSLMGCPGSAGLLSLQLTCGHTGEKQAAGQDSVHARSTPHQAVVRGPLESD